jgi:hypothetical protein
MELSGVLRWSIVVFDRPGLDLPWSDSLAGVAVSLTHLSDSEPVATRQSVRVFFPNIILIP